MSNIRIVPLFFSAFFFVGGLEIQRKGITISDTGGSILISSGLLAAALPGIGRKYPVQYNRFVGLTLFPGFIILCHKIMTEEPKKKYEH